MSETKMKMKTFYLYSLYEGDYQTTICIKVAKNGGVYSAYFNHINKRQKYDLDTYNNHKKSDGMCLFCGDIDFSHLQQHHLLPDELPTFSITLCANCHASLHFYTGGNKGIRVGAEK